MCMHLPWSVNDAVGEVIISPSVVLKVQINEVSFNFDEVLLNTRVSAVLYRSIHMLLILRSKMFVLLIYHTTFVIGKGYKQVKVVLSPTKFTRLEGTRYLSAKYNSKIQQWKLLECHWINYIVQGLIKGIDKMVKKRRNSFIHLTSVIVTYHYTTVSLH